MKRQNFGDTHGQTCKPYLIPCPNLYLNICATWEYPICSFCWDVFERYKVNKLVGTRAGREQICCLMVFKWPQPRPWILLTSPSSNSHPHQPILIIIWIRSIFGQLNSSNSISQFWSIVFLKFGQLHLPDLVNCICPGRQNVFLPTKESHTHY